MKRQGTMHSPRAGLSRVRSPIRSTSDRFTEQGVKQGPGYLWKNLAEVSIVFNSAGWLVGRIAFCHLSFLSLSSLSKESRKKSNFWLATSWARVSGLEKASPVVVS
ncbi:orf105b (mitochondrion) [Beta vulgaris subsp. vulgaris]|uniref:Orf105b protein n=3 Tax=Beta TaxID=3554 RepID=Q9MF48_BETVV|nr:orf105b [Beta vulgaris subsp. vulgaris]YP_004222336.1 hypothetical protein LKY74_mgp063 [Beta vulgaris subsp. maritima]YP_004842142.1 hypothetical protein LKY79_mgp063 [Beta macrocarpa]CBJ14067.1 hypothetical protein [Beta vulgaris subsp. maritima]CBJ17557.1 hypothetical protein [Beta vulgaris subsp. maritima]CBJ20724.1 hypothetical protein [Beta vulgaris subsp. maritima]CBL51972.1 hypothetical protein [Beta vulgaris subsp. maritima]CBX24947.1 hypothetical protein [Beta macrocarpa]